MISSVRRLKAAAVPIAFFAGIALLTSALAQLRAWPAMHAQAVGSDFFFDWNGALNLALSPSWVPRLLLALMGALVVATVAIGVRHRAEGGALFFAATLAGCVVLL